MWDRVWEVDFINEIEDVSDRDREDRENDRDKELD